MKEEAELYNELALYTLQLNDKEFIHQYVVDAFAAQTADENTKPIKIDFALAGLYLHNEKKYTGREVQLAHMELARRKEALPKLNLPKERGQITIKDVLQEPSGERRNAAINKWSESVWEAYKANQDKISQWISQNFDSY
jgi:hypothetical protein